MRSTRRSRSEPRASLLFPADDELPPANVVAGIDEAGLGPLLGPLTIGVSAFRVASPAPDLWRELEGAVASARANGDERLIVADSKLVFARNPQGEARLEAAALSFLALGAPSLRPPASCAELFARMPVDLQAEPWAGCLPERLPLRADPARLARHVEALEAATRSKGIRLVDASVRVLPVAELNASFARTGSKSRTHWDLCALILRRLWTEHAREGVDLLVDRHGGRARYEALLRETLPEARVVVLREGRPRSEYAVTGRAGDGALLSMRIAFAERAERASLPVALASCLAKYARELCMSAFNAYFGARQPGLRPTAGYVADGRRWLREAKPALESCGIRERELVRER